MVQCSSGVAAATTAWWAWSAVGLAAYGAYWAVLWRAMPTGKPVSGIIDRRVNPALARLFAVVALAVLALVFVAPFFAGAPAAAAKYFAPIAAMTALNILLESAYSRRGHVLAVYASTGANNLWRLCAYFAALLDMATAPLGAAPLRLRALAWAGVTLSVAVVLIFEPVVARFVPRQPAADGGGDADPLLTAGDGAN